MDPGQHLDVLRLGAARKALQKYLGRIAGKANALRRHQRIHPQRRPFFGGRVRRPRLRPVERIEQRQRIVGPRSNRRADTRHRGVGGGERRGGSCLRC
jgi:hypothetical protein